MSDATFDNTDVHLALNTIIVNRTEFIYGF